jgi:uncharacterized delta-60 repeat protein
VVFEFRQISGKRVLQLPFGLLLLPLLIASSRSLAAVGDITAFDPNVNGTVNCIAVQRDGKIIVGGGFTTLQPNGAASPTTRNRIARLNSDGSLDTGFDPNAGNSVNTIAVQADGKILLGGNFTSMNPNGQGSTSRNRIARLNADGTVDTSFNPNANSNVNSIALQPDGKILIGGSFTSLNPNGAGSTTRNRIARLNADGTLDANFDPNASLTVNTIVMQPNGSIVVGGSFTTLQPNGAISPTTRNRIARLNDDGTLDTNFDPNANLTVNSIAMQADNKIVVAGDFTALQPNGALNSIVRNRVARLNTDGTIDTNFDSNAGSTVNSIVLQTDGKILIGGLFTTFNPNGLGSITRNRIARLNSDGTVDATLDPNAKSAVNAIAVQLDGQILLGGSFTTLQPNGAPSATTRNRIARLENDPATQVLSVSSASRVEWLRGGASPEAERVTFELSIDGGLNWTALGDGTRISGGWERVGLSLPASGKIRGTARLPVTQFGSSGLVETVINFPATAEIAVALASGPSLSDGGSVDFGNLTFGQSSGTKTFIMTNAGGADVTGIAVTIDGAQSGDFALDTVGMNTALTPGNNTTFRITFTPGASGSRVAALHITSNETVATPFDIALNGTGLSNLEAWRLQHFGSAANSGNGADGNDFDFDGVANLIEFATGSDPTQINDAPGVLTRNGTTLEFSYTRAKSAINDGFTFAVESTTDLVSPSSWNTTGVTEEKGGETSTTEQWKASVSIASDAQRFLRLKVTPP